ncbi:MAG: VOC family protein [Firmicutes bacterium]|nr:VOC family protein [Bacillota bacterium]
MRVHIAWHTRDLQAASRFYETLLGLRPARTLPGDVQFLADRPSLNLALEEGDGDTGGGQHYGIEVESTDIVTEAAKRLAAAGYPVVEERDTVCCHSRQTKVWTRDPDGRRWEVFFVAERYGTAEPATGTALGEDAACCTGCCDAPGRTDAAR